MFDFSDIIDLAIRIEKNGEKTYRKAMGQVSDPQLSAMLERLAKDELEHERWFESLKSRIKPSAVSPALDEMGRSMLRDVLGDQAFSISEADFSGMQDIKELLDISIEFEKDTIIFYEMIGAFIEDKTTIKALADIIDEENRHVIELTELLEKEYQTGLP